MESAYTILRQHCFKEGELIFYDNKELGRLDGQFKGYVEGWCELKFNDGSTAIVRPSRVSPRFIVK